MWLVRDGGNEEGGTLTQRRGLGRDWRGIRPYICGLRRSTMGQGRRWGNRNLGSNGPENFREVEGFYGCIRRMGGVSILKHLGHEGFLL